MQTRRDRGSGFGGMLHTHEIVSRLCERMERFRITWATRFSTGVRPDADGRAAIAEIPCLSGRYRPRRPHHKSYVLPRMNVETRGEGGVDAGGRRIAPSALNDVDN